MQSAGTWPPLAPILSSLQFGFHSRFPWQDLTRRGSSPAPAIPPGISPSPLLSSLTPPPPIPRAGASPSPTPTHNPNTLPPLAQPAPRKISPIATPAGGSSASDKPGMPTPAALETKQSGNSNTSSTPGPGGNDSSSAGTSRWRGSNKRGHPQHNSLRTESKEGPTPLERMKSGYKGAPKSFVVLSPISPAQLWTVEGIPLLVKPVGVCIFPFLFFSRMWPCSCCSRPLPYYWHASGVFGVACCAAITSDLARSFRSFGGFICCLLLQA